MQFAQGVQGHRSGHFISRRRGKLLLGEREVALQRRHRGDVAGFVLQHGRRVRGDDASRIGVGFQPRLAGQEILGLLHRGQRGSQCAAVRVGLVSPYRDLRRAVSTRRRTPTSPRNRPRGPPTRIHAWFADRLAGRSAPTARNARGSVPQPSGATPFQPAAFRPAPRSVGSSMAGVRSRGGDVSLEGDAGGKARLCQCFSAGVIRRGLVRPAPPGRKAPPPSPQAKPAEYDPSFFRDKIRYSLHSARQSVRAAPLVTIRPDFPTALKQKPAVTAATAECRPNSRHRRFCRHQRHRGMPLFPSQGQSPFRSFNPEPTATAGNRGTTPSPLAPG